VKGSNDFISQVLRDVLGSAPESAEIYVNARRTCHGHRVDLTTGSDKRCRSRPKLDPAGIFYLPQAALLHRGRQRSKEVFAGHVNLKCRKVSCKRRKRVCPDPAGRRPADVLVEVATEVRPEECLEVAALQAVSITRGVSLVHCLKSPAIQEPVRVDKFSA